MYRFFLVKYADRGLVQSDINKFHLSDRLYILSFVSFTMLTFLISILPNIRDYGNVTYTAENISLFSDKIVFRNFSVDCDSDYVHLMPTRYLAVTFITFIVMWFWFGSVNYIKVKRPSLKKQYQRNIVTFNQNFYFYIIFWMISISLTLIKIFAPRYMSSENTKIILIFFYVLRLSFICIFRPMTIILLLRKRMPHFFENYKKNDVITIFHLSCKTVCERDEKFKPFKCFHQNARFGSEKKFCSFNIDIENYLVQGNRNMKYKKHERRKMRAIPNVDV